MLDNFIKLLMNLNKELKHICKILFGGFYLLINIHLFSINVIKTVIIQNINYIYFMRFFFIIKKIKTDFYFIKFIFYVFFLNIQKKRYTNFFINQFYLYLLFNNGFIHTFINITNCQPKNIKTDDAIDVKVKSQKNLYNKIFKNNQDFLEKFKFDSKYTPTLYP